MIRGRVERAKQALPAVRLSRVTSRKAAEPEARQVRRLIVRVQVMARGRATGQPILRLSALQRMPPQEAAPQARKLPGKAEPQDRKLLEEAEPQARKLLGPTLLKRRGDVRAVRHR